MRWAGTNKALPPEEEALRYLELGLERVPPGEGEERVRLLLAQAFWPNAYSKTTTQFADSRVTRAAGEDAAAMAERIGRPDLAVTALDAVQYNLQRDLNYRESYATSLRRLDLARTAGDVAELGDSFAIAAWNATYVGACREGRAIGREGYELLRDDAPFFATHSLAWGTVAAFYLGEWDDVLADFDLVREGLRDRADPPPSGFAGPWPAAAFVHEARGDGALGPTRCSARSMRSSANAGCSPRACRRSSRGR